MLNRDKILEKAVHDCYREMYRKAQPSANYDDYIRKIKNGEIPRETRIYERHYLPEKQFEYIVEKYKKAYNIQTTWKENCDIILRDLKEGGLIDGWDDKLDCRGAEHTKPLKEIIGEDNANKVIELIEGFRNFYRFDHEESSFNFTMYLGCGPTSNPKTVIDYWKSQGVDITIDEKKDLTEDDYWELDMYGHISRK